MIMTPRDIRVLDLFAGAGGFTAGFHAASSRFQSVAAVEMDLPAAAAYEATFGPGIVYAGAIQDWLQRGDMPDDIDIVVGGPPCQGFSTLGKQRAEDERNALWEQYAETLVRLQPKYFVVENVAAFAKSTQYDAFVRATRPGGNLAGYAFEHRILNAADFGAPQARKRTVVLGHRRDLEPPSFPSVTHAARPAGTELQKHVTVGQALLGVPNVPDMDATFTSRRISYAGMSMKGHFSPRELHWNRQYQQISLDRFAAIPAGGNRFDLPDHLKAHCWVKHVSGSGDVMGRLRIDKPSVTIRTEFYKPEKGRYIHPTANRAITHYEAALLQGFPPSHRFVGSKTDIGRQIGNAVPIQLGSAIARALLERL